MIRIIKELQDYDLQNELWSGALDTLKIIYDNNRAYEFCQLLEELFPEPIDITALNDFLWFDDEYIFERLSLNSYEEKKGVSFSK